MVKLGQLVNGPWSWSGPVGWPGVRPSGLAEGGSGRAGLAQPAITIENKIMNGVL